VQVYVNGSKGVGVGEVNGEHWNVCCLCSVLGDKHKAGASVGCWEQG